MADDKIIDAKFKVIRRPRRQPRIWFDWRNFLIVAAASAIAVAHAYLGPS